MTIRQKIRNFILKVITQDKPVHFINIGALSSHEISTIQTKTGFNLNGYERIIDYSSVRHILKFHGDAKLEAKRGQIAITVDDFEKIPKIVKPENISHSGKNRIGRDCIFYTTKLGTTFYCVEEIRTGKKNLALNTFYKRK